MNAITGVEAIDGRLRHLVGRDARRIARNAVNQGLTVAKRSIVAAAPVGKKHLLRRDIGKRFKKSRESGLYEGKVGVQVGIKVNNRKTAYAPTIAVGSNQVRFTQKTKTKQNRGMVTKKNDFVKRGWSSAEASVTAAIENGITEGLLKNLLK